MPWGLSGLLRVRPAVSWHPHLGATQSLPGSRLAPCGFWNKLLGNLLIYSVCRLLAFRNCSCTKRKAPPHLDGCFLPRATQYRKRRTAQDDRAWTMKSNPGIWKRLCGATLVHTNMCMHARATCISFVIFCRESYHLDSGWTIKSNPPHQCVLVTNPLPPIWILLVGVILHCGVWFLSSTRPCHKWAFKQHWN